MDEKKSIDKLGLSVRAYNTLKRAGIDTLGELLEVIDNERLPMVRGLGQKVACEIMRKVYCRNCKRSIYGEYGGCDINIENDGEYCKGLSLCGCKVRVKDGRKES